MNEKNLLALQAKPNYRGSVGVISPLYNNIVKGWRGAHPTLDERCPTYNFSAKMEYKLFLINSRISFEAKDVGFIDEEHAKLLIARDEAAEEKAQEAGKELGYEARKAYEDEVNEAVNANKVAGKLLVISYGEENTWNIPALDDGVETLAKAFNTAASHGVHVNVSVEPFTLKMRATYSTPHMHQSKASLN